MKIPFTLEAWLKDKSQRVETRDGRIVHDIWAVKNAVITKECRTEVCALIDGEEDALVFFKNGKYLPVNSESPYDLFIVTPEPELTEFEESIFKLLRQYKECDIPLTPENIKAEASMLWQDFEKYFFYLYGKGEGDSALRSFYYKGLADGKAEALKDLPRWKKWGNGACGNGQGIPLAIVKRGLNGYELVDALGITGEQYIMLSDLEKLPGFKED